MGKPDATFAGGSFNQLAAAHKIRSHRLASQESPDQATPFNMAKNCFIAGDSTRFFL